jgi:hypothetical protein
MNSFINNLSTTIADRGAARVLLIACFCLVWGADSANADVIISDFSLPASKLIASPGDKLDLVNFDLNSVKSTSGAGGSGSYSPNSNVVPSEASVGDRVLQVRIAEANGANLVGGATGVPSSHTQGSSSVAALSSNLCEMPTVVLVTWLSSNEFIFVPAAPRSGLMRPPKACFQQHV